MAPFTSLSPGSLKPPELKPPPPELSSCLAKWTVLTAVHNSPLTAPPPASIALASRGRSGFEASRERKASTFEPGVTAASKGTGADVPGGGGGGGGGGQVEKTDDTVEKPDDTDKDGQMGVWHVGGLGV